MFISAQTLAFIVCPIVFLTWLGLLVFLPVAIYQRDFRHWAREAGFILYATSFALGCVYVRTLLP